MISGMDFDDQVTRVSSDLTTSALVLQYLLSKKKEHPGKSNETSMSLENIHTKWKVCLLYFEQLVQEGLKPF